MKRDDDDSSDSEALFFTKERSVLNQCSDDSTEVDELGSEDLCDSNFD